MTVDNGRRDNRLVGQHTQLYDMTPGQDILTTTSSLLTIAPAAGPVNIYNLVHRVTGKCVIMFSER